MGGPCQIVCEDHKWLNNEAWHIGRNVWHLKSRFHMLQEIAQYQSLALGSPGAFWEYKDEDFVEWVGKLAKMWGGPCTHTS